VGKSGKVMGLRIFGKVWEDLGRFGKVWEGQAMSTFSARLGSALF
jgi:hypothetical protein